MAAETMKSIPVEAGLRDATEREKAVTTFERNVVVTAGAGTGKTALLTARLLHLLFRRDHPAQPDQCAALTFTNKAAGEMADRLRDYLERIIRWSSAGGPSGESQGVAAGIYRSIVERYGWTEEALGRRAREILRGIEQTPISTYHGFAARLLRRYPLQAGVDPSFQEDDGTVFDERFERDWQAWLADELGERPSRKELWERALDAFHLEDLSSLAGKLCSEILPLDELERALRDGSLFEVDEEWLAGILEEAENLIAQFPDIRRKVHKHTEAAFRILQGVRDGKDEAGLLEHLDAIREGSRSKTRDLTDEDYESCRRVIRIAEGLASLDRRALEDALTAVLPFSRKFREDFIRMGYLTFDAQLARARNLLRDHPDVRGELKRRIRHLLLDEFQDTDPIQYEIVFYLAEEPESIAADWREVRLEPGKLFVVGDPKQSIYKFRGADIEAYTALLEDILDEPPMRLSVNFRSHDRLVDVVNGVFGALLQEKEKIQPVYHPAHPRPDAPAALDAQKVEVRVVGPGGGKLWNAEEAAHFEAREIARWIREDLVHVEKIPDAGGRIRAMEYGDIALLFRKTTGIGSYIDALREWSVPYLVESARGFFETQEVTDFLNLLAALAFPEDRLALAGVLRSPLGGLTDKELLEWSQTDGEPAKNSSKAEAVIRRLDHLRKDVQRLPVSEALDRILQRLPVLETAALLAGEQGRSNVLKVRSMALDREGRLGTSFSGLVDWLRSRAREARDEGESPLAEENINAVRLMTVHKAKGLEFPVVVLAGLQAGGRHPKSRVDVRRETSSGAWGLRIDSVQTPRMVRADDRDVDLEDAEERRLFYVAATRARERLVFSVALRHHQGGKPAKAEGFLAHLSEALGLDTRLSQEDAIPAGSGRIARVAVPPPGTDVNAEAAAGPVATPAGFEKAWLDRVERVRKLRGQVAERRPSELDLERRETAEILHQGNADDRAALIGRVAHAALESIDFAAPRNKLEAIVERSLAECRVDPEGKEDREIRQEVQSMLEGFFASAGFQEKIQSHEELGREVPCLLSHEAGEGFEQAVEGRADLVLRDGKGILVVDYKTAEVSVSEAGSRASDFTAQGALYCRAVSEAFGEEPVRFGVAFLRPGVIEILQSEDLIPGSDKAVEKRIR